MKQTILVTGGTGFIGSHTTVELQQAGYDVVIVDNLSNSKIEVLDGIEKITGIRPRFEQIDLCNFADTEAVFRKYPDIVGIIHFAASKAVGESVEKPLLYYRNNIVSLLNLLELMPKYDVKGIIFSSSCTVYGQPTKENLPVTEEAPIQTALSPYGNTKQINEEIIRAKTHIAALQKEIVENQTPGRKIDFLCQEINREINTIGSKNQLAEIGQAVISAKDALENIREQAHNIE